MQRALAAALLAKGETFLHNPGKSNDDKAALNIIKALGADVEVRSSVPMENVMVVRSQGIGPIKESIDCKESGLSIRMFTPIAALSEKEITIDGEGSLLTRPMDFFDDVLPKLGVSVKTNNGKLPVRIKGPLQPGNIEIDGSLSSQYLTGLLMAYSAGAASEVSIRVKNLKSKPYIDLTLDVMKQFGMIVPENRNYEEFIFHNKADTASSTTSRHYTVESDWSGAAFLLVAAAIAGPVSIKGLDLSSSQADKRILDALMSANAAIAIEAKGINVHPAGMNAFDFDATDCPDLFPPLVALAAYCKGISKIKGVSRLIHKESNRAESLQEEFGKMGVKIERDKDHMLIHGGGNITGATVRSHHDHRIAMACAVAALKAGGETIIEEAGAVKKSYPDFYNDLKSLGADLKISPLYEF
jgi:3-phosphoshikimate 1-carboxyvinyltransferase